MADLFKNYHKHKVLKNVGILSISAMLAVSVNMFLLSGNTGQALKANVLEATHTHMSAGVDFSAEASENSIVFKNSQEMQNVTQIAFSLAYNFEILKLIKHSSSLNIQDIALIENNDGFSSYIITMKEPVNISSDSEIIKLDYEKTSDETVHLNIVNVNFMDSEENSYLLSTQSIIF